MTVLLTRHAVLQAQSRRPTTSPQPVGVRRRVPGEQPGVHTIKPNVLERNFVRKDLSPMPFIIGRKVASMEFETELRGNGLQQLGPPRTRR